MLLNNTQFYIESVHYYPIKEQQPMRLRPYEFHADYSAIDIVGQRITESRSGMVTANMLSGVAGSFVQPSAVGHESAVNYSWVTAPRYIFMMKVSYADHMGNQMTSYLMGYTDHDGVSNGGHVNPDMMHNINNVMETVSYTIQTPLGLKRVEKLHRVYNTIYSVDKTEIFTQRPTDMYDVISAKNIAEFMPTVDTVHSTMNMITPFTHNSISSSNSNNITTNYLSSILNGGIHASKASEITVPSMGIGNVYNSGADDFGPKYFDEPSITDNLFVAALSAVSGSRIKLPYFRAGTLPMLDPTVDARTTKFNLTKDFSTPEMQRSPDMGEHWNGQDIVTVKAYSFIENSVALATKYGFTKLNFIASNMVDHIGTVDVKVLGFQNFLSLAEEDYTYLLRVYETKFVTEIFLSETNNGAVPVYVEVHVNLLGTSKVFLQYAGYPGIWYTAPTYSNSLYSPVVTASHATMEHSATEISKVIDTLTSALQPSYY